MRMTLPLTLPKKLQKHQNCYHQCHLWNHQYYYQYYHPCHRQYDHHRLPLCRQCWQSWTPGSEGNSWCLTAGLATASRFSIMRYNFSWWCHVMSCQCNGGRYNGGQCDGGQCLDFQGQGNARLRGQSSSSAMSRWVLLEMRFNWELSRNFVLTVNSQWIFI